MNSQNTVQCRVSYGSRVTFSFLGYVRIPIRHSSAPNRLSSYIWLASGHARHVGRTVSSERLRYGCGAVQETLGYLIIVPYTLRYSLLLGRMTIVVIVCHVDFSETEHLSS